MNEDGMGFFLLISLRFHQRFEFSSPQECITNGSSSRAGATPPEVTAGTKRVCGGSRAAQPGVAPALEIFCGGLCSAHKFVSPHRPTHLFQPIDLAPGGPFSGSWSLPPRSAIFHLFYAGIFLLSSPNSS